MDVVSHPIVASKDGPPGALALGLPASGWPRWGLRARVGAASLLIGIFALIGLGRALLEPSTGWRFSLTPDGRVQATATDGSARVLPDVRALSGVPGDGRRVVLTPDVMVEASGLLNLYAQQDEFHAQHRVLWGLLQQPTVLIETAQGVERATIQAKRLGELGFYFWLPWVLGLLSMSIGLAVWVYRPLGRLADSTLTQRDRAPAWYAVASICYAYFMLMTAGSSSRLLTQWPTGWAQAHQLAHASGYLMNIALCMVLLRHPTRLKLPGMLPFLWLWSGAWLMVDVLHQVPGIALGYRMPTVVLNLLLLGMGVLQWRATRHDPVKRAQIKWLGLLFLASDALALVGFLFGVLGYNFKTPMVLGFGWISLIFLGLVPLVTRLGLFQLERWWATAWLWFLGGLLVIVLDLFLLATLPLSSGSALALALALAGWVYFPLRQMVWSRLARGSLPATGDVLPDIVALITSQPLAPHLLNARWEALWDKMFQPLRRQAGEALEPGLAGESAAVQVRHQGQEMWIRGIDALSPLCLTLPERGQRLFRPDDAKRAAEIVRLVQTGLNSHQQFERGAQQERARIASDLHDDLGATLLSITQASGAGRSADLARQAIEELRLSVRGLNGQPSFLSDALADWRSESVGRLMAASIKAEWLFEEGTAAPGAAVSNASQTVLSARLLAQITRILREALSNVIRHSQAQHCQIRVSLQSGQLTLEVQDDGTGLPVGLMDGAAGQVGMGLGNIERRARKQGGRYALGASALGGVRVAVTLPLSPSANIDP